MIPCDKNGQPIPGIYSGITADEYHASPGVSCSKLKIFEHCPWKAKFGQSRETPALALGTLIHALLLEPDDATQRYYITRADRRGTKAWERDEALAMGRTMIKASDWQAALAMRDAIMEQPIARRLLHPGPDMPTEVSAWWIDSDTGLLCRMRTDAVRLDIGKLIDLKSCDDASLHGWRRSMENWNYDYQGAMYQWGFSEAPGGWKPDGFTFLAVEKEWPHKANGWEHDIEQEDKALSRVRTLLRQWAECERTGIWPGYEDFEQPITLSAWRYRE